MIFHTNANAARRGDTRKSINIAFNTKNHVPLRSPTYRLIRREFKMADRLPYSVILDARTFVFHL